MTAKQFFKSTAFKCVVTLLCVLLISGVFLTIMNGLLAVSDEERLSRALSEIYGKEVTVEEQPITTAEIDASTIEQAYLVTDDGNYLIKSTGKGGYDNGTVTCWVVVKVTDKKVSGIDKVKIDSNVGQSYISRVTDKALNQFSELYKDGIVYEPDLITGATVNRTKNAICNAVNGAIAYVKTLPGIIGGTSATKTPFDDFLYTDRINKSNTTVSFNDGKLTYTIKTKSYEMDPAMELVIVVNSEKKIESFTNKGSYLQSYEATVPAFETMLVGKDLSYFTDLYGEDMKYKAISEVTDNGVTTGATNTGIASNTTYTCMYACAFALANYNDALKLGFTYTARINTANTTWTVDDGVVTYTIKTKSYEMDPAMELVIVVNSEKKIESFTNKGSYLQSYEATVPAFETMLVGKDLSYFTDLYGEDMKYKAISEVTDNGVTTGATNTGIASNTTYTCMYAAAYSLANYDLALIIGGSNNE